MFGAKGGHKSYKAKTREELKKLLANKEFSSAPYLQVSYWQMLSRCFFNIWLIFFFFFLKLVEIHMPREDAPAPLRSTAEAAARNNSRA